MEIIGKVKDLLAPKTPETTKRSTDISTKDEFLKLLTTQLKYQNPLEPQDAQEFAAQLAQFSSVERLMNIETALTKSSEQSTELTQVMNKNLAAALIGKTVRSEGTGISHVSGNSEILQYSLPSAAKSVTVSIKDSAGTVVRNYVAGSQGSGDHTIKWDGKDETGETVSDDIYSFEVNARDTDGNELSVAQYQIGYVEGVRYTSDGQPKVIINGNEVSLSNILEIGAAVQ